MAAALLIPSPLAAKETVEAAAEAVADAECPAGAPASGALRASEEGRALALASACGVPVEVTSARGFNERTWAQADGHLRTEVYAVPRWARDEAGDWVDVDRSLAWQPDGSVRARATVSEVRLSGGGRAPFVTLTDPGGGALSLTWPGLLPRPALDGDTATYAEVLPGVDLAVTAGVDGFWYRLVVRTPAAAANPALRRVEVGIAGHGLDLVQGTDGMVTARDAAGGPVFTSGPALMWDSSRATGLSPAAGAAGDAAPGRLTEMPIELDGGTLAVVPDAAMLAGEDVELPLYIDPMFVGDRLHWANVHREEPSRGWTNDSAWPRAGGMRVGLCTWPGCEDSTGLWRSVVRFSTSGAHGRHVVSAAVKMTQTHTGGCGTYPLELWQVGTFTSGVSWNGVDWLHGGPLQTRNVASSNSGGCGTNYPNRSVAFNNSAVLGHVRHAARNGWTISFGVQSGSESTRDQWRRISRDSLRLEIEHASFPRTPTGLSTHGKGCSTSAPGAWLSTGRPRLTGTPRNADGNGRFRIEVRTSGGSSNVYSYRSGTVTVNRSHTHTVASTLSDGAYRWRMRTESTVSGVPASSYSSWCYFRVDTVPPPEPMVAQVTDAPEQGDEVRFRLQLVFRIHSEVPGGFRYGLLGGPTQDVPLGGIREVGGTLFLAWADVSVTPPTTSIDHQLQVWAKDAAGNLSARHDLWFTTHKALRVPVAGVWRFDGDWRDDSGNAHDVGAGAGISFTADREGRPASAMLLTGESCTPTAGPVLRTDTSFTVAAWARWDGAETAAGTIVSQHGTSNTAFRVVKRSTDQWGLSLLSEDSSSPTWHVLRSSQEVTSGWHHVAGVYDAAAGRMRLYVDGELEGSQVVPALWNASGSLFIGCASTGGAGWNRFVGAIDDLVAYQGVRTSAEIEDLMAGGPPAGQVSWWPLRGDGGDAGPGGDDLTVPSTVHWVPDSHGRAGGAMQLDGASCASTAGPVVRTDDSFTVAAWAKPSPTGARPMTVVSQAGVSNTAFRIRLTSDDRWSFVVMSADASSPDWHAAAAPAVATTGGWQHITGVYDAAAGDVRLYVDGVLAGTGDVPVATWRGSGGLHLGCAAHAGGAWDHWVGAVHGVRAWRGAATPEQVLAVATERVSFWGLDGSGQDGWGDHDLSLNGEFQWVDDRFGFPESALGLGFAGDGWAETAGPVVATDESFTVSAWVRLDGTSGWQTMLSQAGGQVVSFSLSYHPSADRWQFGMPGRDSTAAPSWRYVRSLEAPVAGRWYHLTGVYDLGANEISLYVNGERQGTAAGPSEPWHVAGPLLVGASGDTSGARWDHMTGAVDMVRVYSGVLDERRIADQGVVPAPLLDRRLL